MAYLHSVCSLFHQFIYIYGTGITRPSNLDTILVLNQHYCVHTPVKLLFGHHFILLNICKMLS